MGGVQVCGWDEEGDDPGKEEIERLLRGTLL